jgi:hypothetical protein
MIASLIYIWYLLTAPSDRLICSLWVSQPPDQAALVSACGNLDHQERMIWRGVNIQTGAIACVRPASELPALNCTLAPLSDYRIDVVWPNYQEIACSISQNDPGVPDGTSISRQCPQQAGDFTNGKLILVYAGSRPTDPQPAPICPTKPLVHGDGAYDLPSSPDSLQTSVPYALLAGQLIWYGLVKPACNGWSGLDPVTHAADACGLQSALSRVIDWQNQFDQAIFQAALKAQVPPKVLKGLIGTESQFWPFAVGELGETGLIQLSDVGADIALRYSPDLYATFCPQGIDRSDCQTPYSILDPDLQAEVRSVLRASMTPSASPGQAVLEAESEMPTYAKVLSAYYCYAGEVVGEPSWDATLAIYHAGADCFANGQICQAGMDYIEQVTR